jgi:hypothetical protein
VLAALAGACAVRSPAPVPAIGDPVDTGLVVTLTWAEPVDLDLYVTTPRWETVYYGNPGGAFERDARCADAPGTARIERARWRSPVSGRYRVGVDFPERCRGDVREVPYRIVVDVAGVRREHDGVARFERRDPAALEVDVP